jgi:hypothetical protein
MPNGWLGWDWGNVPSWVGSLLTGSSLTLAAVTYARSSGDRHRAIEETERGQAARVSIWWLNPRKAMVRNGNDVAVTVRVLVGDSAASEQLGLGPDETRGLLLPDGLDGQSGAVALTIVDSHGRSWIRRADATLDRVTTASSPPVPPTPEGFRWADR